MKIKTQKAWQTHNHKPYITIGYNVFIDDELNIAMGIHHHKGNEVYVAYWGEEMESFDTMKQAKDYLLKIYNKGV